MNPSLWAAKTGLDAQQIRMQVVANNLANANTTGFKRDKASFEDLLYQNIRQTGGQSSQQTRSATGLHLGTGVRMVATSKMHVQGGFNQTEGQLDIAIQGRGFFQILTPNGQVGYSRDGSFNMDANGTMVTASGNPLQPNITIPANAQSVTIGKDGVVSVRIPGVSTPSQVGSILLADFANPAGLEPAGENMFLESASSGSPTAGTPSANGFGGLIQGSLEASNVNVVEEMVNMIETQRAYEMNTKAISTSDQMMSYINQNL
ncbi:MAG: flagellar basal-body rod protein FlgG [Pseudomonadales bacterium]|nr:flagellar basal-body rod protein FlgG [Pseudomonadales bacterium]